MSHHHLLIGCAIRIGCEISIAFLLVKSINALHHILISHNLAQQLTIQVVEIQMVITISLAGQKNIVICQLHIFQRFLFNVFLRLILYNHLADSSLRINHIDTKHILMTIHREYSNLSSIAGGFDTRNIPISI